MSRTVTVAVIQAAFGMDRDANLTKIADLIGEAAGRGAQIVLPPELFASPYFPKRIEPQWFDWAEPIGSSVVVEAVRQAARAHGVIAPCSFFERDGERFFNSLAMIDASGEVLGVYRKSHIPSGEGYEEKAYFAEGDTGFRVWDTELGRIGVGICWDQWFPEAARAMALAGAELLLYPTAIGSEPQTVGGIDTSGPWMRVMQGHAAANCIPVAAANRIGDEDGQVFYGHSFLTDQRGAVKQWLREGREGVLTQTYDLDAIVEERRWWGFFQDRRPDLYGALTEPR